MDTKLSKLQRREMQRNARNDENMQIEKIRDEYGERNNHKIDFMVNLRKLQLKEEGKDMTEEEWNKIIIPTDPKDCIKFYNEYRRLSRQ